MLELSFEAKISVWSGEGAWRFVTLPAETAQAIRAFAPGPRRGFGSVRVTARIGETTWRTSVFPDAKSGSFLLPLQASVRAAEKLADGQAVAVRLELDA